VDADIYRDERIIREKKGRVNTTLGEGLLRMLAERDLRYIMGDGAVSAGVPKRNRAAGSHRQAKGCLKELI